MRMRCRCRRGPRDSRRATGGGRRDRCRHGRRRRLRLVLLARRGNRGNGATARGRGRSWLAYLLIADAWVFPACGFGVVVDEITEKDDIL